MPASCVPAFARMLVHSSALIYESQPTFRLYAVRIASRLARGDAPSNPKEPEAKGSDKSSHMLRFPDVEFPPIQINFWRKKRFPLCLSRQFLVPVKQFRHHLRFRHVTGKSVEFHYLPVQCLVSFEQFGRHGQWIVESGK